MNVGYYIINKRRLIVCDPGGLTDCWTTFIKSNNGIFDQRFVKSSFMSLSCDSWRASVICHICAVLTTCLYS